MKQKEAYDKGRKEPTYKEGDKVWARVHEPVTFGPKREGPYIILDKITKLNYRLGEIGKAKLRRHPIVNVKHIARYRAKTEEAEELTVDKVISHRETRRGPRFKVRWADGETTEEPLDSFVDVLSDGRKRWNKQLKTYAKKNGIRIQT